jgi:hypothetical protein|tara:strand:+ start:559 stop:777 length:219 start_codon:yes stop_codon:yes gene_type:complete
VRKLKCQHCDNPNPENWFFCRDCGKRASAPKFTTNSFVISEAGKRTDVEFNTISYDESINKMNKADKRWKGF